MKIPLDKYYTPIHVANHCWEMTYEAIGKKNITEVIEPSIGSGAFLHHPQFHPDIGYDIEPECESNEFTQVYEQDFLELNDNYKPGRLIIGNPPYGERSSTAQKFYRKATNLGDYIAFILPISQKNNTSSLYQFDLIYSEDLGEQSYSGRELHCCFNVYQRPPNGKLNSKHQTSERHIAICRKGDSRYETFQYDYRLCYWGGNAGKLLDDNEDPTGVYKIKVINPSEKEIVKSILADFTKITAISAKSISQDFIHKLINSNMEKKVNEAVCQPKDKNGVNAVASKNSKPNFKKLQAEYDEAMKKYGSFVDLSKTHSSEQWDGEPLEEDKVYHQNKMGGLPILIMSDNRRTIQRAWKMLTGCEEVGMTTPAILVKASLIENYKLKLIDPVTLEEATPEQIANSYAILEGHGRHYGWLLAIMNKMGSPEKACG